MILPFGVMLAAIACAPIFLRHHWERHYHEISVGLGSIPVLYYLFVLKDAARVGQMAHEYVSFMAFIGSLFVVAGGMRVTPRAGAKPLGNTLFLLVGALAANVIGTTGAAMLLIQPWIRMNRGRYAAFHTVFFIFIVANEGGCLTPIGNPPLFLGFIKGVPFWWVLKNCWEAWAIIIAGLLTVFYFFDRASFQRTPAQRGAEGASIGGAHNILFFAVIVGSLFVPGPPFLREAMMVGAAFASCVTTSREARRENGFTFAPIQEVAWLFAGIFGTMLPALDYLQAHARQFGISTPAQFYWLTGDLSAVLDNAPTYLAFAATEFGLHGLHLGNAADMTQFLATDPVHILAISLGAVFFGAMTYIGNGPNLMVKSIVEKAQMPAPNFAEYIYRYSLPILLPLLALISWVFFR